MQLTGDGISGDRVVHVAGPRGPLTDRTPHRLLAVHATPGPTASVTRARQLGLIP